MKVMQSSVVLFLALLGAGCAHSKKLAALYVPIRCIQTVSWTKPCATVSPDLIKCDGVMVRANCVSAHREENGRIDRGKLVE
jgi:hypothetical protein